MDAAKYERLIELLLEEIARKDGEAVVAKKRVEGLQREIDRLRAPLEPCAAVERRPSAAKGEKAVADFIGYEAKDMIDEASAFCRTVRQALGEEPGDGIERRPLATKGEKR